MTIPTEGDRRLRVELKIDGELLVLARLVDAPAHWATLDPYVAQLTHNGIEGELRLIDEETAKTEGILKDLGLAS